MAATSSSAAAQNAYGTHFPPTPSNPQAFGPTSPSHDIDSLGPGVRPHLADGYSELSFEDATRARAAEAAEAVGAAPYQQRSPLWGEKYTHPDAPTVGEVHRQLPKPDKLNNLVRYKGPTGKDVVLKQAATNTELQKAVELGDADLVAAILRYGLSKRCVNVNAPLWPKRERLLHIACRQGFREVCTLLLEAQAELDCEEVADGKQPLHEACASGRLDVCELLLDRKARLEDSNFTGMRPLHWAAAAGHKDVCDLLLDRKAKNDAASGDTREPLHHASANGHDEVVRLLCKRGCKPDAEAGGTGSGGQRPLQLACLNGHKAVVAALLDLGALASVADFGEGGSLRRLIGTDVEDLVRNVERLRFRSDEAEEFAEMGQDDEAVEIFKEVTEGFTRLGLSNAASLARSDASRSGIEL